MRAVLALLSVAAALAATTTTTAPAAAGPALAWRTPPGGAYRVKLPPTWRFADATYPSDHFTHLWFDPRNALRKLLVVGTACIGCVTKNVDPRRPNPAGLVPENVLETVRLSPWKAAYETYTTDDPYPDHGLVVVLQRKGEAIGGMRADLWLPESQRAVATSILNSFTPVSVG